MHWTYIFEELLHKLKVRIVYWCATVNIVSLTWCVAKETYISNITSSKSRLESYRGSYTPQFSLRHNGYPVT